MRKATLVVFAGCLAALLLLVTFPPMVLADCPDEEVAIGEACYETETLTALAFALEQEGARFNARASELMELGYEDEALGYTDKALALETQANDLRLLVEDLREQPLIVDEMVEKETEDAVADQQSKLRVALGADSYEVDALMQLAQELEEEATELNAKASELMEQGKEDEALEYTDQALELEIQANDLRLGVEDLLEQARVEKMTDKAEREIE